MRGIVPAGNDCTARAEGRYKTFFPAFARTSSGTMRVHILDVSRAGARLHGTYAVEIKDILQIAFDGDQVAARVQWIRGEMFGTQFCCPLPKAAETRVMGLPGSR